MGSSKHALALAWLLALPACKTADRTATSVAPLPGIGFTVTEKAYDGEFGLEPGIGQVVDVNSIVHVDFSLARAGGELAPSPAWDQVQSLLARIRRMEEERSALRSLRIGLDDPDLERHLADLKRFDESWTAFQDDLANALPALEPQLSKATPELTEEAVDERFDEIAAGDDPSLQYTNIARWLRGVIERLQGEAESFAGEVAEKNPQIEVTVQAYLDPIAGDRKALHVANYDNLPVGELRPIDRFGLKLTPAEERRLRMELQQADNAAAMIREISAKGSSLREGFLEAIEETVAEIKARLEELEDTLAAGLDGWIGAIDGLVNDVEPLTTHADDGVREAATELVRDLGQLGSDLRELKQGMARLGALKREIDRASAGSLDEFLFGSGGLRETVREIVRLIDVAGGWPGRIERILRNLGAVPDPGGLLPEPLQEFFGESAKELPRTLEFLEFWMDYARLGRDAVRSAAELGETAEHTITRTLDDLTEGTVDLRRAGLTPQDHVLLIIRLSEKAGGGGKDKVVETTYDVEARPTGLHRRIGANLIFARGSSGTPEAKSWKPNVAVTADWRYYVRDPASAAGKVWNVLDPGMGIHVAGLDQGDDDVEVGVGLNVSIFGGFVVGGYGWNLSVDRDREYFFIGLDLFELFEQVR